MLYGISSIVSSQGHVSSGEDAEARTHPSRGLFRERLRFYLNNLDGFVLASREIVEGVR
jgi:hypothetical protein